MGVPLTFRRLALTRLAGAPSDLTGAITTATAASAADRMVFAPRIGASRFLDIAKIAPIKIWPIEPVAPGYDRSAATRPIADAVPPADTMVFVDAAGSKNWYLPRYRLKVLDGHRYDIAMADDPAGGFRLTLGLERYAAPEVASVAGAAELPHELLARVAYKSSDVPREIPLDQLTIDDGGLPIAVAARLDLQQRDSVMNALQRDGVRLLFLRHVQLAVPIAAEGGARPPAIKLVEAVKPELLNAIRADTTVWNRVKPARLLNRAMLSTMINPDLIADATAAPPAPTPPAPRYQDLDATIGQPADAEPLVLDPTTHSYFYTGTAPRAGGRLQRLSIAYTQGGADTHHPYFQDGDDRQLFYYLPDVMRLARPSDAEPYFPEMKVRMSSPDGSLRAAQATIDYAVRPFTLPGRLEAAMPALAAAIPASAVAPGAQPAPRLEAFPGGFKLKLRIPGASGAELRTFDGVESPSGDLDNGFRHTFEVPLDVFRQLFAAALTADATSLFTGEAAVDLGSAGSEAVPVEIRFAQTEGPLFDVTERPGDAGVEVTMRNAIESPVRIDALPMRLARGGAIAAATIDGLDLSTPVTVAPGESVSFTVRADPLPAGEGPLDALFDFAHVAILATAEALLPVVSDSSVPADYVRAIEVMALPEVLDAPNADGTVQLVQVEFETGDPVRVTKATPSATAAVRLPLVNMLLGKDDKGAYRYRQLVVRERAQAGDADWRTADFGLLVVPVTP